jgi:integrase
MSQKLYYLVKRKDKLTEGKPTYYCRFRDENGTIGTWKSTGENSKTRAELWAIGRIKKGETTSKENITFGLFSLGWWTPDCLYTKRKRARGKSVSPAYADVQRIYLNKHIMPFFKDIKLARINQPMIDRWLMGLNKKGTISGTTINHCLTVLRIMMKEAVRRQLITIDPCALVEQLKETPKEKTILSLDEVKAIFKLNDIDRIWGGDLTNYTLNLLAAMTGMRMGEVQALQIQHIHSDCVDVVFAWSRNYGLKEPKWNSTRIIPITKTLSDRLQELIQDSPYTEPEDFIFYGHERNMPIPHKDILTALYKAFEAIKITPDERKKRNVTFHSWRHLFNSLARSRMPDYKVQKITGHRTIEMTDHYTHASLEDLREVLDLQNEMIR